MPHIPDGHDPDGLIFSLYRLEVGQRHDMTLLRNSGLKYRLCEGPLIGNLQFHIYGDATYVLRTWMQTAFDRATGTYAQAIYNTSMSRVWVAVEWNYKDMKEMWKRNDFPRLLQVRRFPVGMLYIASGLLLNFKNLHLEGRADLKVLWLPRP